MFSFAAEGKLLDVETMPKEEEFPRISYPFASVPCVNMIEEGSVQWHFSALMISRHDCHGMPLWCAFFFFGRDVFCIPLSFFFFFLKFASHLSTLVHFSSPTLAAAVPIDSCFFFSKEICVSRG